MKTKLFTILIILSLLTGCSATDNSHSKETLWLVTELTTADSFNYQIEAAVEHFEAKNDGIAIQVDVLPTDTAEREIYLKQLRTQIMSGNGPDIYLLPTGNTLTVNSGSAVGQLVTSEIEIQPLFPDLVQAMYSGIFADISSMYDSDPGIVGLRQDIMDAGTIKNRRYVLPLRYTMPVMQSYNTTEANITELVEQAVSSQDIMMAMGLEMPDNTSLLSKLFDYQKGELLITQEEIAQYMRLYQQWYALSKSAWDTLITQRMNEIRIYLEDGVPDFPYDVLVYGNVNITRYSYNDVYAYGRYGYHWSLEGFPSYSDTLTGALDQSAIGKVLDKSLISQPMRNTDGAVVAEVTYYGAIGSSCREPGLAYDFLRMFLTEEYQWDMIRPRAPRENIDFFKLPAEVQVDGMIEDSWPVRTTGATAYLWDTLQYQNFHEPYNYENRHKALKSNDLNITDSDLPILNIPIDEVRFPFYQPYEESLGYALSLLNNEDGSPTDADIDTLASEVVRYLWWHLAEG